MKKYFLLLSIIASCTLSFASQLKDEAISGHISQMILGEIDPNVLGDKCIVHLNTDTGRLVGLVTDYDQCASNENELFRKRELTVALTSDQKITNSKLLKLLSGASDAQDFYEVEFGAIENGLADREDGDPSTTLYLQDTRFTCSYENQDINYSVALIASPYVKSGYEVIMTQNFKDKTSSLIFQKEVIQNQNQTKHKIYTSAESQLQILNMANGFIAFFNLTNEKVHILGMNMSCRANSTISYSSLIYLEPRISVGN